jgi:glycosyltransferase involved in cell wall biosynthesis
VTRARELVSDTPEFAVKGARTGAAPRVAVLMSRFPAVTETFILRELVELERQGAQIELVPLLRDQVSVLHPDAAVWDRRAHYTPFVSRAILAANLAMLWRAPRRYLGTLLRLARASAGSVNALVGLLGIFPKSVYLAGLLRSRGVEHVHAHYATHPAAAAYVIAHVHDDAGGELPYSVTVHAHDLFITQSGLALKLGAARFVRCISRFNADFLMRALAARGERIDPARLCVLHCGIHPERYAHRPRAGAPGRERAARLLCIASHRPYKGLSVLIDAVRLLRERGLEVSCEVIGEGVLRPQLEAQIRASGLEAHVRLVGTRSEAEVTEALSASDVFVLPSVVAPDGQMEGIPIVLMEALAAGLPTISTSLSGIPELVIDQKTGFLVPPGDAAALAGAVERVLADYALAKRLAASGRELVRREYEIGAIVRHLLARCQRVTAL